MIKKHLIKLSCVLLALATLFYCSACGAITDDTTTTVSNTSDTTTTAPVEQLSNEDQAFLNGFYESMISYDRNYKYGVGNILITKSNIDNETVEYLVQIRFGNSNAINTERNLSFKLYNDEGANFINICKDYYEWVERDNKTNISSRLYSDPTTKDVEFYKFLNTYTSNVIDSANS